MELGSLELSLSALKEIPSGVYIAAGAILAGFIASLASLLSLIISKENKTSEFRQEWINELRAEISAFLSSIEAIAINKNSEGTSSSRNTEVNKINFNTEANQKALEAYRKIKLMLNSRELSNRKLESKIDRLYSILTSGALDRESVAKMQADVIATSRKILKKEWRRVKDGEAIFGYSKWLLILIVIFVPVGVFFLFIESNTTEHLEDIVVQVSGIRVGDDKIVAYVTYSNKSKDDYYISLDSKKIKNNFAIDPNMNIFSYISNDVGLGLDTAPVHNWTILEVGRPVSVKYIYQGATAQIKESDFINMRLCHVLASAKSNALKVNGCIEFEHSALLERRE